MVTNEQIILMIGIPMLGNTVVFGLFAAFMSAKFDALIARLDAMDKRLDTRLKHLESR